MAPDPNILHEQLLAALRALPDIGARIYDGIVPENVPEAGGYIRPYAVVFSGLGSDLPEERDLTRLTDTGVLEEGPNFPTTAQAVSWGLVRTPQIVVVDADGGLTWAGDTEPPEGIPNRWTQTD